MTNSLMDYVPYFAVDKNEVGAAHCYRSALVEEVEKLYSDACPVSRVLLTFKPVCIKQYAFSRNI